MAMFLLAAAIGALALACLIISIRQFQEKGFLFNNAWLWASEKERRTMDKKPHYHQSGVVFAFLTAIFFCVMLECLFQFGWLRIIRWILTAAALFYAFASSFKKA